MCSPEGGLDVALSSVVSPTPYNEKSTARVGGKACLNAECLFTSRTGILVNPIMSGDRRIVR